MVIVTFSMFFISILITYAINRSTLTFEFGLFSQTYKRILEDRVSEDFRLDVVHLYLWIVTLVFYFSYFLLIFSEATNTIKIVCLSILIVVNLISYGSKIRSVRKYVDMNSTKEEVKLSEMILYEYHEFGRMKLILLTFLTILTLLLNITTLNTVTFIYLFSIIIILVGIMLHMNDLTFEHCIRNNDEMILEKACTLDWLLV